MCSASLLCVVLGLLGALVPSTEAHGFVTGVRINNVFFKGFSPDWGFNPVAVAPSPSPVPVGWAAKNNDIGFVAAEAFSSPDINCHKNATAAKEYARANAGDAVEFVWNQWIASHKGPVLTYIAPCGGDCTTRIPSSMRWTKIAESGLLRPDGDGYWAADELRANNNTGYARLPKQLEAGNYVLRHEIIALHGAREVGGAQMYPQCINVKVAGTGTLSLPEGVSGSNLYSKTEPGILVDIYRGLKSYQIPGPSVWAMD